MESAGEAWRGVGVPVVDILGGGYSARRRGAEELGKGGAKRLRWWWWLSVKVKFLEARDLRRRLGSALGGGCSGMSFLWSMSSLIESTLILRTNIRIHGADRAANMSKSATMHRMFISAKTGIHEIEFALYLHFLVNNSRQGG